MDESNNLNEVNEVKAIDIFNELGEKVGTMVSEEKDVDKLQPGAELLELDFLHIQPDNPSFLLLFLGIFLLCSQTQPGSFSGMLVHPLNMQTPICDL